MGRHARAFFLVAFVAVVGGAAWIQYEMQRARPDRPAAATHAVTEVLDTVVDTENAARTYTALPDPTGLDAYRSNRTAMDQAAEHVRAGIGDDDALRAGSRQLVDAVDGWAATLDRDVSSATGGAGGPSAVSLAAARAPLVTQVQGAGASLVRTIDRIDREERDAAGRRGILLIIGLCVAFAAMNWLVFARSERRAARARERQLTLAERLQQARTEDEARSILARHLESLVPDSIVMVSGSADHPAGRPITAHGEGIGAVIIRSPREPRAAQEALIHDSIVRATPVLATLRNLTIARTHAATDALTGLGNRRLVEDALVRMAAQARRSGECFTVAMIDLDRFKAVNDTHGHEAGDAMLVAVAEVLNRHTREYDIVGRRGGDEFIMLLAGLDDATSVSVMDRCRRAIGELSLGSSATTTSASIGVATSPRHHAVDAEALVLAADRALYAAKARGGDCVMATSLATAETV